jgi:hypothetical protein
VRSLRWFSLVVLVVTIACSSAAPTRTPEVTQKSPYLVWYRGPEIDAELNYRWADGHLGDEWLIVKLSLVGAGTRVDQSDVRVRTPDGHTIPLLDQQEFRRMYGKLRIGLDWSYAWEPPTGGIAGSREPCGQWFLVPPGQFLASPTLYLTSTRVCTGPLVFQVPIGVQPGRWVLMIDLEESDVRIPFVLGG